MLICEHVKWYFSFMSTFLQLERKRLGFTANEVVLAIDSSRASFTRWESGSPIPSDKLAALSELGFDVGYVVTGKRSVEQNIDPVILKRAMNIVANYISKSGQKLAKPELLYDCVMNIHDVIKAVEDNGAEVDPVDIGAKVIQLFAA